VKCEVPGCTNERIMGWRPVGCPDRFRQVCRVHRQRHDDPGDAFDLHEAFGLPRSTASNRTTDKAFPDFGKELRRPFEVRAICYDCAEFYGPGDAWPANKPMFTADKKHLRCLDFLPLPDVMPGTHGQVFPPSRMKGRKTPRERQDNGTPPRPAQKAQTPKRAAQQIDPKRRCACGSHLPVRRRYCDACRERRRREARDRFEQKHPGRLHRVSGVPQNAPQGLSDAPGRRAIVNRYRRPLPLKTRTSL